MRYLLVDGQGNFGSVDGDAPAAMRYTEVRMSRIAQRVARGHRQGDRRFRPELRRVASASRRCCRRGCPNLLVNGSSGIAVGMATNIPPHNLARDRRCAASRCIDDPEDHARRAHASSSRDRTFRRRGIINGVAGIVERLRDRPRPHLRARARTTSRRSTNERPRRDHHHRAAVPGEQGAAASSASPSSCATRRSKASRELRDESDKDGMRVVIELKRGEMRRGRPEQSLQADAAAERVRHQHGRARRRPAEAADAEGDARSVPAPPPRGRHAAHAASICARRASARTSSKGLRSRSRTSTRSSS